MSGSCVPLEGGGIICYTTCWACKFENHFDPPAWHTWADRDDIDWAKESGQADPSEQRCGCSCAKAPRTAVTP